MIGLKCGRKSRASYALPAIDLAEMHSDLRGSNKPDIFQSDDCNLDELAEMNTPVDASSGCRSL